MGALLAFSLSNCTQNAPDTKTATSEAAAPLGGGQASVKDGKITVNGTAHVIATIPATNGIIHLLDGVLLPPTK